jgi:hypothetical protein
MELSVQLLETLSNASVWLRYSFAACGSEFVPAVGSCAVLDMQPSSG